MQYMLDKKHAKLFVWSIKQKVKIGYVISKDNTIYVE